MGILFAFLVQGTTVVQTTDHTMPAQMMTRQPYMGTAEIPQTYATTTYDPNAIPSALVQKVTPKFAGKRPIKMPRRGDRAVKAIRTDLPGPPCTSPMAITGYPSMVMAAPQRMDEAMLMNYGHMGGGAHLGNSAHMGGSTHMGGTTHMGNVSGGGDNWSPL